MSEPTDNPNQIFNQAMVNTAAPVPVYIPQSTSQPAMMRHPQPIRWKRPPTEYFASNKSSVKWYVLCIPITAT